MRIDVITCPHVHSGTIGLVEASDDTQVKVQAPGGGDKDQKRVKFSEEPVKVITIESSQAENTQDGIGLLSKEERSSWLNKRVRFIVLIIQCRVARGHHGHAKAEGWRSRLQPLSFD